MNRQTSGYLYCASAMAIVGSSVAVGKMLVMDMPVFLTSGVRFVLAALFLMPLVFKIERGLPRYPPRDWLWLTAIAFSGQFMFSILLLFGLKLTSAQNAGIITSTTPAMVVFLSAVLLREKMSIRQIGGVVLAVAGIMAINLAGPENAGSSGGSLWGNLLIVGAVTGEALFTLLRKKISPGISALSISGVLNLLGFFMFLPFAAYDAVHYDFCRVTQGTVAGLLHMGLMVSGVAYIFWFSGVTRIKAGVAGVFTAILPVSALFFSWLLLKEPLTWRHLAGLLLILAAICAITAPPPDRTGLFAFMRKRAGAVKNRPGPNKSQKRT